MRLEPLRVLSDREIADIHDAALDILFSCGVRFDDPETVRRLAACGCETDEELVRFSPTLVERALSVVPPTIEVFDREGTPAFTIGEGESKIAAGHNAVFWLDSDTRETRQSRISDVERFARICEHLDGIDMIGIPVMPQDAPNPRASLLYAVEAVVRNSRKPVFFSTDNRAINRGAIELLAAGFAGDFSSHTYGICQLSPTSPLYWERGVLEAILDTLETSVPIAILPEPNAGVSAPYTLAGLVAQNHAECLSGIVMIELLKPGTPVLYANSWTTSDMRTGAALVGSTETSICRIAGAQLARHLGIPSHTTAPNSDNHTHDEQNAWEKTYSAFCAVAATNDLVVNCGMFATGMTCSDEQLVIDEEISAMARRITRGLTVTRDTIAAELVKSIGPKGDFLTADHTLRWLRSDEYLDPRVSVRTGRATWVAQGARDTTRLARIEAQRLADLPIPKLDATRMVRLARVLEDQARP